MSKRKVTLASVTWMDACVHHGMFTPEEVDKAESMVCHMAGYLLKFSRECIKLSPELMDKADGRCREVHTIRRVDVKKIIRHVIEVEEP